MGAGGWGGGRGIGRGRGRGRGQGAGAVFTENQFVLTLLGSLIVGELGSL